MIDKKEANHISKIWLLVLLAVGVGGLSDPELSQARYPSLWNLEGGILSIKGGKLQIKQTMQTSR